MVSLLVLLLHPAQAGWRVPGDEIESEVIQFLEESGEQPLLGACDRGSRARLRRILKEYPRQDARILRDVLKSDMYWCSEHAMQRQLAMRGSDCGLVVTRFMGGWVVVRIGGCARPEDEWPIQRKHPSEALPRFVEPTSATGRREVDRRCAIPGAVAQECDHWNLEHYSPNRGLEIVPRAINGTRSDSTDGQSVKDIAR